MVRERIRGRRRPGRFGTHRIRDLGGNSRLGARL